MCVCLYRFVPRPGPQYVLVTYSHNVAFGPLLPFPLPLFLGSMVSHPAETTRLSLRYRSVLCSGCRGGGCQPPLKPGAGRDPGLTTITAVPRPSFVVFPRGKRDESMSLISKKFGCLL